MVTYAGYQQQSMSCPGSVTGDAGVMFLAVINALFTNQCQLGNKGNYPPDAGPYLVENDTFDYIIVGGGTAGSVIAGNLAKNTKDRVLLLEAGVYPSPTSDIPALYPSLQRTTEDWQFHTEKSNFSGLAYQNGRNFWPSGRVLGGTSTINSMLYMRGNKQIFNNWAEQGNIGWSYQDVLPFFKMSEKLEEHDLSATKQYGKNGELPLNKIKNTKYQTLRNTILNSAKDLGYKLHSHEDKLGFFEAFQTIQNGVRKNAAGIFLADYEDFPNLKVATDSFVEKILIDADLKEANGVQVNIAGTRLNLFAEKEVIISAGPVNSPKLLMLSGIGPKQHLGSLGINVINDMKVGENLQDHLMYPLFAVKITDASVKYIQQNPTDELYKYFSSREGILSNTGISNIVGMLSTNNSADANIKLNYIFVPKQDNYILSQLKKNSNTNGDILKSLAEFNKHSHLLLIQITLMDCKSKGRIRLRSKNPHEKPLINPGYLSDEKDLDELLRGIRLVEKQIETPSFRKLSAQVVDVDVPNCRRFKFKSDEYWRCAIRNLATSGHSVTGSCKMGLSIDPDAIVDPLLKVHGVGKVRVVDSSILPTNINGNLAATVMMIGQKGSDMIMNGFRAIKHV